MDDIKKLRNLLHQVDNNIDFKNYDKKIEKYYSDDFKIRLDEFSYDKNYFIICDKYFENYDEYFNKLKTLKEICNKILINGYSLNGFKLPSKMYRGNKLLLNKLENVEYIIEYLDNFNSKSKIYSNVNDKYDFEILKNGIVVDVDVKRVSIKRKYYKIDRDSVISDIVKKYKNYYISDDCFDLLFSLLEKKRAKKNVSKKIKLSLFKGILINVVPVAILLIASTYVLKNFSISIPVINFSFQEILNGGFSLSTIIPFVISIGVIVGVFVGECFLSREILNKVSFYKGSKAYLFNIIAIAINILIFSFLQKFDLKTIGVSIVIGVCSLFFAFFAGPDFRKIKEDEKDFSLLGRLIVSLSVCDFFFLLFKGISGNLEIIILLVIVIYGAVLGNIHRSVSGSLWYGGGK